MKYVGIGSLVASAVLAYVALALSEAPYTLLLTSGLSLMAGGLILFGGSEVEAA